MKTKVTDLLDIQYPIIQGGMAWVAEHHLAAAVSEAGGFGIIGAANAPAQWVREQIRLAKEKTDKPFGVNVMLMSPYADEVAQVIAEEGVKAVTTGAGNPEKYMEMWKKAGIRVIPVVASVALAKRMERCGADAVVAEGCESGGHVRDNHHGTGAPGSRWSTDSGDCSRRYRRRPWDRSSIYAGSTGSTDGNLFCSNNRMPGASEL